MKTMITTSHLISMKSGQALIETVLTFLLITSALTFIFIGLSTGAQVFIWHQKVNKALLCSLNQNIQSTCFKDFVTEKKNKEKKMTHILLKKFKYQKKSGIPKIEIEIIGYFNEVYRINKSLNKKSWRT